MGDPNLTLIMVAALAVLAVGGAMFALMGDSSNARTKQRLSRSGADIGQTKTKSGFNLADLFNTKEPTAADRLRELQDDAKAMKNAGMRTKLEQAGIGLSPAAYVMRFQLIALVILGVAVFLSLPLLPAVGVAALIALFGPKFYLNGRVVKRTQKFLEHFPAAIDVLVRGVQAGMPVNESLRVIGEEISEPVGGEIRRVVNATQLGQNLEDALEGLAERVPSTDVNFFRTVLSIQKQTGGNLAESLGNLAEVLRERQKLKKKVRALSSEARMSAIIIGSLPFAVTLMLHFLQPEYLNVLFTDFRGQVMIGVGLVWMSFGVLMMRAMIKFEV